MAKKIKNSEKTVITPTKRPKTKMPKTVKVTAKEAEEMSLADAEDAILKIEKDTSTEPVVTPLDTENASDSNKEEEHKVQEDENVDKDFAVKKTEEQQESLEQKQEEIVEEKVVKQEDKPIEVEQKGMLIDLTVDIDGSRKKQKEQNTMRKMMGYDHMGMCYDD